MNKYSYRDYFASVQQPHQTTTQRILGERCHLKWALRSLYTFISELPLWPKIYRDNAFRLFFIDVDANLRRTLLILCCAILIAISCLAAPGVAIRKFDQIISNTGHIHAGYHNRECDKITAEARSVDKIPTYHWSSYLTKIRHKNLVNLLNFATGFPWLTRWTNSSSKHQVDSHIREYFN